MSRFVSIDPKLEMLTTQLWARLTKDRPHDPHASFEERRIDWEEEGVRKAIIIQPSFELEGVNQNFWYMSNVAWRYNQNGRKEKWIKRLVEKKEFEFIERNIDSLLAESVKSLNGITYQDLM